MGVVIFVVLGKMVVFCGGFGGLNVKMFKFSGGLIMGKFGFVVVVGVVGFVFGIWFDDMFKFSDGFVDFVVDVIGLIVEINKFNEVVGGFMKCGVGVS